MELLVPIKADVDGVVVYNEDTKRISVNINSKPTKARVEEYLNKEQEYRIPESKRMDDFRVERAFPKDSKMHFELAMCCLFAETNVWVDWAKQTTKEVT